MSAFPPGFVEELRGRISLSDVVGRRVQWDRRKTNAARRDFWACCPFHSERSPSFHVDDGRGFYKCFGCGASGDAITFLMEIDKRSFPEAVEELAGMAGVDLPERTPGEKARADENDRLRALNEAAAAWFETRLAGPEGAAARAYLVRRGLRAETIARFRLGYAPRDRHALSPHLARLGFTPEEIATGGLAITPEGGDAPFDRFRDRVMFPILDPRGRVIAFGGRAMAADAQAKYLNSPETPLFHKGATLYNLFGARRPAIEKSRIVVAEGYMDVIALSDAGIAEAVAPLGTALTEEQLLLLWKIAAEPILCFDGDKAGFGAALRALDRALPLLKPGQSLRFALLPDGKDPDDLVRGDGPAAMEQVLANASPLVDLLWRRETEGGLPQTPERRAGLQARVMGAVRGIADPIVREFYQRDMRARLNEMFGGPDRRPTAPRAARGPGASPFAGPSGAPFGARGARPSWRGAPPPPSVPTEALARSALARGDEPPAERALDLVFAILLGHTDLLVDHIERLALTEPVAPWRRRFRDGLIRAASVNGLDTSSLSDHLSSLGLAQEEQALRQRLATNPDWAAARPGADAAAVAARLFSAFEAVEAGLGAGDLAARVERDVVEGAVDPDLEAQVKAARREDDERRAALAKAGS